MWRCKRRGLWLQLSFLLWLDTLVTGWRSPADGVAGLGGLTLQTAQMNARILAPHEKESNNTWSLELFRSENYYDSGCSLWDEESHTIRRASPTVVGRRCHWMSCGTFSEFSTMDTLLLRLWQGETGTTLCGICGIAPMHAHLKVVTEMQRTAPHWRTCTHSPSYASMPLLNAFRTVKAR